VGAIGLVASALAHDLEDGRVGRGVAGYLMLFFAIWWAWMNLTWFASAYDSDDTAHRLLTMGQMGGVLVLAAGVPAAFDDGDLRTVTIGYAVMRSCLVVQWLRAAAGDPAGARTCHRYALGVGVVQVAWLLRLLLPDALAVASFLVLVVAELAVPAWAERAGRTSWHPHHVAERYGLFVLILLGESVLAATTAVQLGLTRDGVTGALVAVSAAGLMLLFGLWWLYFLRPTGEALAEHRERVFRWGYGHYLLFAALGALGAGLEVAAAAVSGHGPERPTVVSLGVAVPVAVFVLLLKPLHGALWDEPATVPREMLLAAAATLALAGLPALGTPLPLAVLLLALPVGALVTYEVLRPPGSR
jgi:low temperature requirement protein LtrA